MMAVYSGPPPFVPVSSRDSDCLAIVWEDSGNPAPVPQIDGPHDILLDSPMTKHQT